MFLLTALAFFNLHYRTLPITRDWVMEVRVVPVIVIPVVIAANFVIDKLIDYFALIRLFNQWVVLSTSCANWTIRIVVLYCREVILRLPLFIPPAALPELLYRYLAVASWFKLSAQHCFGGFSPESLRSAISVRRFIFVCLKINVSLCKACPMHSLLHLLVLLNDCWALLRLGFLDHRPDALVNFVVKEWLRHNLLRNDRDWMYSYFFPMMFHRFQSDWWLRLAPV